MRSCDAAESSCDVLILYQMIRGRSISGSCSAPRVHRLPITWSKTTPWFAPSPPIISTYIFVIKGIRTRSDVSCHADASMDASVSSSSLHESPGIETGPPYSLKETQALVETAMLAALGGLAYLLGSLLKFENTVGYFLPLPIILSSFRSSGSSGWKTMSATTFLLIVLLGPLKALSYLLLHGSVAATLGSLWTMKVGWWASITVSSMVRMLGQLAYLLLSSVTMNENFFGIVLNNVHSMLDQISAAVGATGAPSPSAVACMLFALLLVNSVIYSFLLHVAYRLILQSMGYQLGPLPGFVQGYLYAGMNEEQRRQLDEQTRIKLP